jgi:hypothetical protein
LPGRALGDFLVSFSVLAGGLSASSQLSPWKILPTSCSFSDPVEQPGKLPGVETYHPVKSLPSEHGAYVVDLEAAEIEIVLPSNQAGLRP